MTNQQTNFEEDPLTRRERLRRGGMGMGALALAQLIGHSDQAAAQTQQINIANPLAPRQPHFAPRAKRVIHLFMNGGPSHVDTFDPKPELDKYDGKRLIQNIRNNNQ